MFILSIIFLITFVIWAVGIFQFAPLSIGDELVRTWLLGWRSDMATTFFKIISASGEAIAVGLIFLLFSWWLWQKKEIVFLKIFWLVAVGSEASMYLLKHFIARPRPVGGLVLETSASFPSNHSVIAVAFYGFIFYCLIALVKKTWQRFFGYFCFVLFVALIGLSRLYLGVHYFSDVIGGFLLGGIWLVTGIWLTKKPQ